MPPMTNVTVKVDRDVLSWAQLRALQYRTSINRVLADALLALAQRPRPGDFPPGPPGDIKPPFEVTWSETSNGDGG